MSIKERHICRWYVCSKDYFLFIFENGKVMDYDGEFLLKEKYRCKDYFRWKGTSRRVSVKTIKNKFNRCDVIMTDV